MKQNYALFVLTLISLCGFSQNVTITKIIETGCSSPFVKTVELYVDGTVDFSTEVTLNYMLNGAAWADNQIDISGLGTVTDKFVYIVRDISLMQTEFPSTTFDASNTVVVSTSTNGDDGYQVVLNGTVVSQFGRTETDADDDTQSNWNHNDAVATRKDGIPDLGTWDPTHWDITAENDLDNHTACQANGGSPNLETYFGTLGSTYSLGSGSGWTPTGSTCTTSLGSTSVSCTTATAGGNNDTYSATVDFSGGNTGKTFVVSSTEGVVGGDDPTSVAAGTITITGITEGTDITVTVNDIGDGGVCNLTADIDSPACIPIMINEVLFDPASDITGDANGDGTRDALDDEFIEFYNNSGSPLDISSYEVYDSFALTNNTPRHIFPANTIIPANGFLVLFGGGTPTGSFGGAVIQTASETIDPELNLSNSGDVITVLNTSGDVVLEYVSSSTGVDHGSNVSVTRNPDFSATFALHTDANASLLFSPGSLVDGSTLSNEDGFNLNTISMYPNPASEGSSFINVTSSSNEPMSIVIYNLLGKQVSKQMVTNQRVDISQMQSGIYLMKISQGQGSITKKILIQ